MKSLHCCVQTPDSYEAGIETAEKLKTISPEIVIVFFSIRYNLEEFFEAFYSVIPEESITVWGGSGDGVYSAEGVFNNGVSAVGINSGGKIKWSVSVSDEGDKTSYEKAETVLNDVLKKGGSGLKAGLVLADFMNDGVEIADCINSSTKIPFAGGLTGDDWQFKTGFIILNGKPYNNAVSFLGMSGDFSFAANCASGWKPIGKTGIVKGCDGNTLKYIDDKTAYDFIEEEFGLPPAEAELGVISLAAFDGSSGKFFLRTLSHLNVETGFVTCFGSIPVNTRVRVCNATKQDVIDGAEKCLDGIDNPDFRPLMGIVISCGGRKWILQEDIQREVEVLKKKFGEDFPFTGFASFGEFGPYYQEDKTYSRSYFHNVSFSVMIIGEKI